MSRYIIDVTFWCGPDEEGRAVEAEPAFLLAGAMPFFPMVVACHRRRLGAAVASAPSMAQDDDRPMNPGVERRPVRHTP